MPAENAQNQPPEFQLSKWYLDAVDQRGDVFIGYQARLRWKRLRLHYASALRYRNGGELETATTLRKLAPPRWHDGALTWQPRLLQTRGTWKPMQAPITRTLLQSERGDIRWRCHYPKARAEVVFHGENLHDALGYAEELELTIKPWQLPFGELRWGRFLSPDACLVWISWDGQQALNLVYHNSRQVGPASITDTEVEWNGGSAVLAFSDTVVLRQGPLVSTALAAIPGVDALFPNVILRAYECKWRSRGRLRFAGARESMGWVIHEVVRWN